MISSTAQVDPPETISAPRGLRARFIGIMQRRPTWVLLDQGIVSAGNFLTANLLARHVAKAEFGTFQFLLESILYFNGLQAALITYPLSVQGARSDKENLGRLASASILLTGLILPLLAIGLLITTGTGAWEIALPAVAAMLLWQLQETMRRGLMSDLRFADAIWGDAISYPGQAICVFLLAYFHVLSLKWVLVIMGGTSAAAAILQALQIGLRRVSFSKLRAIAVEFWELGRWMLLTSGMSIITVLGYWWVLKMWHGVEEVAIFGAIVALFKLANPVTSSMSGLIVPAVARVSAAEGSRSATRVAIRYIGFGAVLLTPYYLVLVLFPHKALSIAYGASSPYVQNARLLQIYAVSCIFAYVNVTVGAWLAGLGRSKYNFYVQAINVAVGLMITLPMTAKWGSMGLAFGGIIVTVVCGAALAYLVAKTVRAGRSEIPPNIPTID